MFILNTILDILFPVNCLSCGKSGKIICYDCLANFPKAERYTEKWIYPVFDYRHPPIKKSIWLLKYKNKKVVAKILGEILHEHILEEFSDLESFENFKNPILIPIPLSKKRYKERGYNQAELLCKEILNQDKENIFELETKVLLKNKETEHQARIKNRNERLKNLKNTFSVVNSEKIKDRNIILIDDVTTTGATLAEARKILKISGAKKVIAFAVAH